MPLLSTRQYVVYKTWQLSQSLNHLATLNIVSSGVNTAHNIQQTPV